MNIRILRQALAVTLLSSSYALAAPVQFNVTSTVTIVEGSYVGGVVVGDNINGSFLIDNDSANAGPGSDPGPGTNPGHEYTSFWNFDGAPYGVELIDVQQAAGFSSSTQAVVVNDGMFIDAEETGGLIPTGTYDWLELLGSTTVDYCPGAASPVARLMARSGRWPCSPRMTTGSPVAMFPIRCPMISRLS
ncbi:hypothetical protein [Candidatus Litorirhabdus singularis]|uniref:hypothetical protein n=1 Tax=Candidatus Litorirhabdus singularis TaxID=2518993 RepID=UPI00242A5819|nr:hypothetical protein [Candidatus Litorirhabdus singularis]